MKTLSFVKQDDSGMTLIEVLIAIGLLALVVSGAFTLMTLGNKSWNIATTRMDTRSEVSRSLSMVTSDLRSAKELTNSSGILATANKNEAIAYVNVDGDSDLEKIRYHLSNNQLKKDVYQPTQTTPSYTFSGAPVVSVVMEPLTNSDTSPIFKYFTAAEAEITSLPASSSDLKLIARVDISINSRTVGDTTQEPIAFRTSVYFRNIKR